MLISLCYCLARDALELKVEPQINGSDLKGFIAERLGIPSSCQKLVLGNTVLQDKDFIAGQCAKEGLEGPDTEEGRSVPVTRVARRGR